MIRYTLESIALILSLCLPLRFVPFFQLSYFSNCKCITLQIFDLFYLVLYTVSRADFLFVLFTSDRTVFNDYVFLILWRNNNGY